MGRRRKATPELLEKLKRIKAEHPNYGRTRAARELRKAGFQVSDKTTGRALKRLGLQLPPKKRGTKAS